MVIDNLANGNDTKEVTHVTDMTMVDTDTAVAMPSSAMETKVPVVYLTEEVTVTDIKVVNADNTIPSTAAAMPSSNMETKVLVVILTAEVTVNADNTANAINSAMENKGVNTANATMQSSVGVTTVDADSAANGKMAAMPTIVEMTRVSTNSAKETKVPMVYLLMN